MSSLEKTIPLLPCQSIGKVLDFYNALGFETTYRQDRPNTYAVVRRGGIELHFFVMKDYEPLNSYSSCLVVVPNIDELHSAFMGTIKSHYGRRLSVGIPRIGKLNHRSGGSAGFVIVDPGGNWIRFTGQTAAAVAIDQPADALPKAVRAAELIAYNKGDFTDAAARLDEALRTHAGAEPLHLLQALVVRASIAIDMGAAENAAGFVKRATELPLREGDREAAGEYFDRLADLQAALK